MRSLIIKIYLHSFFYDTFHLHRTDKGQTVKASYVHLVNPLTGTEVAAEMTHRLSDFENSFSIGSVHKVDPLTLVKTRFSDNGKVALLSQREWRPKSLVTFSAEYDTKATNTAPKFGLSIALKPWISWQLCWISNVMSSISTWYIFLLLRWLNNFHWPVREIIPVFYHIDMMVIILKEFVSRKWIFVVKLASKAISNFFFLFSHWNFNCLCSFLWEHIQFLVVDCLRLWIPVLFVLGVNGKSFMEMLEN